MTVARWLVVAVVVCTKSAGAQSELNGRIVTDSGKPIAGATVTLTGIRYTVRIDSLGRFRLAGTPGSTLNLTLQAAGFRDDAAAVVLARGKAVSRDFIMVAETIALPEANRSDRVLRGRITTVEGEPVGYANLTTNGGRRFVTDDSGRFSAPFNAVPLKIIVRRIGFEPTEIRLADLPDTTVRIQMKGVATTLETQIVTVRSPFVRLDLGGFYRRMADVERGARVGYFVTPEDLALRNPVNVTDAVEQFPNIRLAPIDDGQRDAFGLNHGDGVPQARKFRIEDSSGCPLTVYLDRVRIQPRRLGLPFQDEEINAVVQPQAVAGIEVYPRDVMAPSEFPVAGGTCGVVLIWSR